VFVRTPKEATIEIQDQVIAITGASAGIGAATSRLLAARG
jgi:NADP-dependent 3-hydroxy acid dehydrogenase YdfG